MNNYALVAQLMAQSIVVIVAMCAAVVGTISGIYLFKFDLSRKKNTNAYASGVLPRAISGLQLSP